jgi:hypothetical protein
VLNEEDEMCDEEGWPKRAFEAEDYYGCVVSSFPKILVYLGYLRYAFDSGEPRVCKSHNDPVPSLNSLTNFGRRHQSSMRLKKIPIQQFYQTTDKGWSRTLGKLCLH